MIKKTIIAAMAALAISLLPTQAIDEGGCIVEIQNDIEECSEFISMLRSDYAYLRRASSQLRRIDRHGGELEDLGEVFGEPEFSDYTMYLLIETCEGEPGSIKDVLNCVDLVTKALRSEMSGKRQYQRSLRMDLRNAMRNGCDEKRRSRN